jgi:hypothetical protein
MSAQCDILRRLCRTNVVQKERPWLDWGAGDGKLSDMLRSEDIKLLNYDAYMSRQGFLEKQELTSNGFDLVISTSVFEHVRSMDTLDEMERLVSGNGVFAIHTLIADEVPVDPTWFYYQAPHVAFFTNHSMKILFRRWGYASCLYHVPSRLWFFFKDEAADAEAVARQLNSASGHEVARGERDFVAYWTKQRLRERIAGHA